MSVFYGFELETAPGLVMAPRPATEALVDAAVALVAGRPARVADVGTGSGAIAIALASRLPQAEIWASDVSPAAVDLARLNAARHGFADRIHMAEGDLLDPIPGQLCVIVGRHESARGGNVGRREHAQTDRLAMAEAAVVGQRFERVADGMPEIEDAPRAGFTLVRGDHARLQPAAFGDERSESVRVAPKDRRQFF